MAVRCAHCGEELMGAVNRCWKCGRAFAAQPASDGLPPVRRVPVPMVAAEVPGEATAASESGESGEVVVKAELATESRKGSGGKLIRTGSPFSPMKTPLAYSPLTDQPAPLVPLSALPIPTARKPINRRPNYVATGGAIGGIVLGCFALALAPFRAEAALVALIGMMMGLWGLYSPKRGWALVGLLICCLAIGWASYTGAKALNALVNRNKAWDPDAVEFDNLDE